ncbi:MFS transporter [Leucobacter sp. M11]|uniref:MFS transporter n=1 Tax=Leucobacter sp. M11 TaxID=2993565 RepID=UPI002D80F7C9|nr:MFS transporter [Leucobacter sp. M11]MEB4615488.1 MFS transporter [Leucobacter sp. M11]
MKSTLTKASVGAFLGSTIEWYDFFIYGTASALIFNRVFFEQVDPALGTLLSMLTFAVGFLARPLGAVIFGHIGDRYGRKRAFTSSLLVMGIATVAIGLLPSSHQIGGFAAVLLVTVRIVQGIGVGGEWGGAVLVMTENAPPKWRAFFGVVPQLGSPMGTILSNGAFILVALLPEDDMYAWGWRVPFLVSAVLIVLGYVIRRTMDETEGYKEAVAEHGIAKHPVKEAVASAWGRILLVAGSRVFELTGFTVATVFVVSYVSGTLQGDKGQVMTAVIWGGVAELITLPVFAVLMLKIRPKSLIYWAVALGIAYVIPFFLLININEAWSIILAMLLWFPIISMPFAAYPTLFGDLFDSRIRYSGISLGFNLVGIFSGFAPAMVTGLFLATGSWLSVAIFLGGTAVVTLVCVLAMQTPMIRSGVERDRARIAARIVTGSIETVPVPERERELTGEERA